MTVKGEVLELEIRQIFDTSPDAMWIVDKRHRVKHFNDYYGHQLGDDCLWSVAQAIEANVRRPADLAARYGGEEFAVILPNTPLDGGVHVAEGIRRAVSGLQINHSRSAVAAHVTMSIGVSAVVPGQGGSAERLLQAADTALYHAKSEGRNCVRSRPLTRTPSS